MLYRLNTGCGSVHKDHGRGSAPATALMSVWQLCWRAVTAILLCVSLTACAVSWISPYSKESTERITDLSKSILGMYQDLLLVEHANRVAAAAGALKIKQGEIETKMRVHLLHEQARARNVDSITIADNLLSSWLKFGTLHQSADPTALGDATLFIEREILQRHLRSALVAEETKKLGGAAGA